MDIAALLTSALFVGGVVLALQIADAVGAVLDARRQRPGHDGEPSDPDTLTRRRVRELSWTVVVTAALAVLVAFGVDSAARLVWDRDRPVVGALILLGLTLLTFAIGIAAIVAVVRRERPTYARIRRDLRDRASITLDRDELAEFDERVERADRLRVRRSQGANVLRAFGVAILLALVVLAAYLFPVGVTLGFVAAALLGVAAFVVALRSHAVAAAALDAVLEAQRAEVMALLERARIPARGRVPGLGNRVARALAILREQQK
ncbi:hypothetical protein ACFPJ4_03465 [Lysinimonas soli]|uniref:Phage holin family protein n=1 Tax=Lysinimonas soli TaxID=1074233 RepID=A0ABW0NMU6_9MICO